MRDITKANFKYNYSLYRQDGALTYVDEELWDICREVERGKELVDSLIVKKAMRGLAVVNALVEKLEKLLC